MTGMKRRTFSAAALATVMSAGLPMRHAWAGAHTGAGKPSAGKIAADINAVTGAGGTTVIKASDLNDLQAGLRGKLLLPNAEGYDAARRGWNGMIDRRPALIVQCRGAADVTRSVNLAREYSLLTAIKGGGHSVSGNFVCEGGLMLDMSQMQSVRVDPVARSAWAEPGVLLGAVDHETQAFGLATPAGVVSHTGAAGLTLGGGFGALSRVYGLTIDNVRYFDVVTASGEFKRASVSENPDLFWGLRGGGGNFGVVTSIEYQLHKVGTQFLAGSVVYPMTKAREALTFFAEFQANAPKELRADATVVMLGGGRGLISISVFYIGDPADGEKTLAPLRAFGKPASDDIGVKPYTAIQKSVDRNVPHGTHYYQKAGFVRSVEPKLIEGMLDIIGTSRPFTATINFNQVGGAISQIANDATAYANRDALQQIVLGGSWAKPVAEADDNIAGLKKDWERLAPFMNGFYVNNMTGDEDNRKVSANYGSNYARLARLKAKYDPTNLFRLNPNVLPSA
jgi:FAD/FMN-containing dehydrogenase